jgi:hypothetical protein
MCNEIRRILFAVCLITLSNVSVVRANAIETNLSSTPISLQLRYVGEPDVCAPIAESFRKLHKRNPRATYLSDVASQFFALPGISQPRWLKESDPAIVAFPTGQARFLRGDFAKDGVSRLLAVEDTPLGSHGDFVTWVWVAKSGRGFDLQTRKEPFGGEPVTAPDPGSVDLLINFQTSIGWKSFKYPLATIADGKFGFSTAINPDKETNEAVLLFFNGYIAQEAFLFHDRLYFVAGTPFVGSWLIYRLDSEMTARVVCFAQWN